MRYEAGRLVFSPSDLVNFLDGDFSSWMDRWYIENSVGNSQVANESGLPLGIDLPGITCKPDEDDSESQLIATKGVEHEQAFLQRLQDEGHDVEIIDNNVEDRGANQTREAMQKGAPYIYQGRLEHDSFGGFADFLVRQNGESELGDYFYEVWDTKLARSLKAYFIVMT